MSYSVFFKQHYSPRAVDAITRDVRQALESGRLMLGPFTERLERFAAGHVGLDHAATVNTCTTALTICLKYYNVAEREVLVPAATFITDASSVVFAGGKPVLVDVNPDTLSFDLNDLKKKRTKKTKGVIWAHLTGLISEEYREIAAFCRENDLFLIEDCAQAHGARIDGKIAGSLGDVSCFSFYPTKVISGGGGGLLASNDPGIVEYAKQMRLFGKDAKTGEITDFGNDWFMDEIKSAVIYHHFQDIAQNLECRRKVAGWYRNHLKSVPGLRLLPVREGNLPSYYQFAIRLDDGLDRDRVMKRLKEEFNVDTRVIYLPIHHEKIFLHLDTGDLRQSERVLASSVCLPLHHELTEEDILHVSRALGEVIAGETRNK